MEHVATYKLPRRPKPDLFPTPPYCRKHERIQEQQKLHLRLEVSDPANILHLMESLDDVFSAALEVKINTYLQREIEAEFVFVITFLPKSEEAIVKALGDTKFDLCIRKTISNKIINVMREKAEAEIDDSNVPPDVVELINTVLQQTPKNILTVPVITKHRRGKYCADQTPLLICVVNTETEDFIAKKFVREAFRFCLPVLLNTAVAEEEERIKKQCQALLAIARRLFSSLGNLDSLLHDIMGEARLLINAERCSLFLLDADNMYLVARVFDGGCLETDYSQIVKIGKEQGIAGHVVTTGKLLNIKNAYKHPLFFKGMDEETGFHTRNILCFPIHDEKGIIGVAQLCNKISGNFDCYDEEAATALSIYCGLSIMHSMVYKKIEDAQKRSELSNELMMYHMKVSHRDIVSVSICPYAHNHPFFNSLTFSPREIVKTETACYVLKMFTEFDFLQKFSIKRDMLVRFILIVRKGYRETPYHNWTHAFTVAHFAYLCLKNFNLVEEGYFTDLEAMALLISCLCHDIDHRGTNNSFQLHANNVLANLYSSEGSVMERHHFSQSLVILNNKHCNFLESLDTLCYKKLLDFVRSNILATDLATHLKIYEQQRLMAEEGFRTTHPDHKRLLMSLIMTCADLSDQTKDWKITRQVAVYIYDEFFKQGDMEKEMGKTPLIMMDREKAIIPDLQVQFLTSVCLPVFTLLAAMFPAADVLLANVRKNVVYWDTAKEIFEKYMEDGMTSYDILKSDSFEADVEAKVKEDEAMLLAEEEEEEESEELNED